MAKPDTEHTKELEQSFMANLAVFTHNHYADFLEEVLVSDDLELKRKVFAQLTDTLGWKKQVQKDPTSNLPMANITINLGSSSTPTITVESITLPEPTPAIRNHATDINDDVNFDD